jgi:hypothetical protein
MSGARLSFLRQKATAYFMYFKSSLNLTTLQTAKIVLNKKTEKKDKGFPSLFLVGLFFWPSQLSLSLICRAAQQVAAH